MISPPVKHKLIFGGMVLAAILIAVGYLVSAKTMDIIWAWILTAGMVGIVLFLFWALSALLAKNSKSQFYNED